MRTGCLLLCGTLLCVTASADPAPPHDKDLLSDLEDWEITAGQKWVLSKGVLSKTTPTYRGSGLLIVKRKAVAVPAWYCFGCDLVNPKMPSNTLPMAGLVFGYLDDNNYWNVTVGRDMSAPVVKLTQVRNGKLVSSTSVPVPWQPGRQKAQLALEVRHQDYVKVFYDKTNVLTLTTSGGFDRGRVGVSLQSGECSFANVRLAGIAKR